MWLLLCDSIYIKSLIFPHFSRWKFGSRTGDQKWRRSWKTASFHQSTAPAPATPWRATHHSPRPFGTHRGPPGRTAYSHKALTRRPLTFWKAQGHGTPQPAAPWLPTSRPLTRYSTRWLSERGRYIEKPVVHFKKKKKKISFYGTRVQISEEYAMYLMTVIEETCKMCKCVHVIYCIFGRLLNV